MSHLAAITHRIQTVQFLNLDVFDCIQTYNSPRTLFYCDPPYLHSARGSKDKRHQQPLTPRRQYRHELTDEDHRRLATVLHHIQGRAIISGYDCPLYKDLYSDWQQVKHPAHTSARSQRVECLWLSPESKGRNKCYFLLLH